MKPELRLLCVLAHPDDESIGTGGTLAHYAQEGVATYLLTATRGERGWQGEPAANPGMKALGQLRENELQKAAHVLGLREVRFLDYCDGDLDQADPDEVIAAIAKAIREIRPHVVITFGPEGTTGHPDHIAISQFTTAAVMRAAQDHGQNDSGLKPHQVDKLYYFAETREKIQTYDAIFGDIFMKVDGVSRYSDGWQDWAITTRLDTAAYWPQVWEAISCHRSQLPGYEALSKLPEKQHLILWGTQEFYRVFSLVNAGRQVERDIFAGLR